jgi:hypothetical protein
MSLKEGHGMSPRAKKEYLDEIFMRFRQASKKEKTLILDEFCLTCSYHRKHAIRLLRRHTRYRKKKHKKRGKPSVYNTPTVIDPLKHIWLKANLPCSKRLKAIIPLWLPWCAREIGPLPVHAVNAILTISPASIDRAFQSVRVHYRRRGRATTKPGTLLRNQIPIKTNQWDETRPGFLEADSVAHCGESLAGMFAYTVDCVDIATGWTEQRAVWGRGEGGVLEQIRDIERSLPFPLRGFDCDNGGEFLNHHLMRYFLKRKHPIQFTRSRSYHNEDNAHVEQKNWTHVRQWLGYLRLDTPTVVPLLNQLYTAEWRLFHNLFCPSVKLLEKKLVAGKIVKRYDSPKTPYQRALESPHVDDAVKQSLKEQMNNLNPFHLRKEIEKKLKAVFTLCRAVSP